MVEATISRVLLEEYESEVLPEGPDRYLTTFYPLEPIGIGTADVESLSGYIARLALAHRVPVTHLLYQPFDAGGQTFTKSEDRGWNYVYVNGRSDFARQYCDRLEVLTGQPDLDMLTCLPFARALATKELLHEDQHWCPWCFQDALTTGAAPYERLYWMLKPVSVCVYHDRPLHNRCPSCQKTFRPLRKPHMPGFCGRCASWLGLEEVAQGGDVVDVDARFRAAATRQLLEAARSFRSGGELGVQFERNVAKLMANSGGASALHRATHMYQNAGNSPVRAPSLPTLKSVLALTRASALNPATLLLEDVDPSTTVSVPPLPPPAPRKRRKMPRRSEPVEARQQPTELPDHTIRQAAASIMGQHDFRERLHVEQLASEIGCRLTRLLALMPDIRGELMRRYINTACNSVRQEIAAFGYTSQSATAVAKSIGLGPVTLRHYAPDFYAQLKTGRAQRLAGEIRQRVMDLRQAIEEMLSHDIVIPTLVDVGRILNVNWKYIRHHLPDLADAIVERHQRQMEEDRTRWNQVLVEQIRAAIQMMEEQGEPVSAWRLRERFGFATWHGEVDREVARYRERTDGGSGDEAAPGMSASAHA